MQPDRDDVFISLPPLAAHGRRAQLVTQESAIYNRRKRRLLSIKNIHFSSRKLLTSACDVSVSCPAREVVAHTIFV